MKIYLVESAIIFNQQMWIRLMAGVAKMAICLKHKAVQALLVNANQALINGYHARLCLKIYVFQAQISKHRRLSTY